jgi:hypothetical protein
MKSPEIILRCKLLQPILDLKQLVERHTERWSFTRPYYIDEKYVWEIYATKNPEFQKGQQKLKEAS